jgi:hypothetical protein
MQALPLDPNPRPNPEDGKSGKREKFGNRK